VGEKALIDVVISQPEVEYGRSRVATDVGIFSVFGRLEDKNGTAP
jgi:hypothetical protein